MSRENIKDNGGRILGSIETLPNGDKVARDVGGRILGYYRKGINKTTDVTGRHLGIGDFVVTLIMNNKR